MLKLLLATVILVAFTLFPAFAGQDAQQPSTPPAATSSPCKTDDAFHAFNFWVGQWKVTNRSNGAYAGDNSITVIEGGCALMEDWRGLSGSTGKSLNYYNPVTGKWRQLWLSGGAYSLDIEGGMRDGSMMMEGTIWYYANGKAQPFRGTWTPNEDGSVRQFFEQYDVTEQQWQPWFDGLYVRQP